MRFAFVLYDRDVVFVVFFVLEKRLISNSRSVVCARVEAYVCFVFACFDRDVCEEERREKSDRRREI